MSGSIIGYSVERIGWVLIVVVEVGYNMKRVGLGLGIVWRG